MKRLIMMSMSLAHEMVYVIVKHISQRANHVHGQLFVPSINKQGDEE